MISLKCTITFIVLNIATIIYTQNRSSLPTTYRPKTYRAQTIRPRIYNPVRKTIGAYAGNNAGRYVGDNAGRYSGGNSGRYDASDGRYVPDDGGRYVHQNNKYKHIGSDADPYRHQGSGADPYRHQSDKSGYAGDGRYIPDNGGQYEHVDNAYKHVAGDLNPYKHQKDKSPPYEPYKDKSPPYEPYKDKSPPYEPYKDKSPPYQPYKEKIPASAPYKQPATRPPLTNVVGTVSGNYEAITAATLAPIVLNTVSQDVSALYQNRNHTLIFDERDVKPDSYDYTFKITNTIHAGEKANIIKKSDGNETVEANGFYEYVGPDAVLYRVDYASGEDGYAPKAAHLPTPPPTPDYILKMLEWQRANGFLKDDE